MKVYRQGKRAARTFHDGVMVLGVPTARCAVVVDASSGLEDYVTAPHHQLQAMSRHLREQGENEMKVNVVVPARPALNKSYVDRNDARRLVTPIEFDGERVKVRYADGRHATLVLSVFHRAFCLPKGVTS